MSPHSIPPAINSPVAFSRKGWLHHIFPLTLLCLTFGLLYRNGLTWLAEIWSYNDYSHGFLVPLVSLYIVWEQRERYRGLPIAPAYLPASLVFLVSLALLIISRSSAFIQIELASLFLILPGIILFVFGRQVLRAALMPWLYLGFALPWFDLFLGHVQPIFQRISAIMGAKLLSLFYPVYLHGISIQLPSINMVVAKECSGVSFFISVLAIGIPLVYLTQQRWSRALFVLAMGLLITIVANWLRVAMAGIMGQNFGPELLHGPSHVLQGWLVAWFGWAGLFVVNWLVIRKSENSGPKLSERWKTHATANTQQSNMTTTSAKPLYLASFILALCAVATSFLSPRPVPLPAPLASALPLNIGHWQGAEGNWLEKKPLFPGADDQLERQYRSTRTGATVYLYIAYFNRQTEQKRLIRQLSTPLHTKAVTVTLANPPSDDIPVAINRTTLIQNTIPYKVFFWYRFANGKTATGQNQARLTAMENGILHQHNNGAVILVGINGHGDDQLPTEAIPTPVLDFLNDAAPEITRLFP